MNSTRFFSCMHCKSRRPATGVSRALRARSVPESVPENGGWGCPRECPTWCPRGPKGPGDTPSDTPRTPPIFGDTLGDTLGTLRARRARETPVAGRRDLQCMQYWFCAGKGRVCPPFPEIGLLQPLQPFFSLACPPSKGLDNTARISIFPREKPFFLRYSLICLSPQKGRQG